MNCKENRSNKILKGVRTFIGTLFIVSIIFSMNVIGVSAKTKNSTETYTLILEERDGIKEQINGADINLNYGSEISYDEKLLQERINKLSCVNQKNIIESSNAYLSYVNGSYALTKEVYGNRINKDALYANIVKAIKNKSTTLNLETENCYDNPKVLSTSPQVIKAKDTLNKYISSRITYNYAGIVQVVDAPVIRDFLSLDANFNVVVYEDKIKSYVNGIANNYTSSLGRNIPVCGGYDGNNHSWIIDSAQETAALINAIKSGQTITRHPIYAQTSTASYFSNVGSTYVEVDMTKQHLWFYKDGYLVVDGDVVTGNLSAYGCETPTGVYKTYSMSGYSVLSGPGYASPVNYWMPFKGNYGLHDAPWRSEFGGEIYKTDGSHGCVNLPYSVAKAIYDNGYVGLPVILFYS